MITRPAIVTAVTVGTSSAQGVAGKTRNFLLIQNQSASATVSFAFASAAVLNGAGSFTLAAGASMRWDQTFVPSDAINFIASAGSTPVSVME